jgi:IS1 family transposase
MNKLPLETRVQILSMLVEGSSMRSISRVCDVSINTVTKLLVEAGAACMDFHSRTVKGLQTQYLQCDEIWSFCVAKQGNVKKMKAYNPDAGDVWTFTALDRDSKMIVTWFAGDRTSASADAFMADVAARIDTPVQLTTDGWKAYERTIAAHFSEGAGDSYAQQHKNYAATHEVGPARKYSPGKCISSETREMFGTPEMSKVSTSHVERQNLSMRMGMRRFTRLTNGFNKKLENHLNALALYFVHYNFCGIHKTLRTSPAQAAGVTDELLSVADIVKLIDDFHPVKPRGPYRKKEGTFPVGQH